MYQESPTLSTIPMEMENVNTFHTRFKEFCKRNTTRETCSFYPMRNKSNYVKLSPRSSSVYRHLLKKYHYKWFTRKHKKRSKADLKDHDEGKMIPQNLSLFVENSVLENRVKMPIHINTSVCGEFGISEMDVDITSNRGNGNSPFNSSNSCGSPENIMSVQSSHLDPNMTVAGQYSSPQYDTRSSGVNESKTSVLLYTSDKNSEETTSEAKLSGEQVNEHDEQQSSVSTPISAKETSQVSPAQAWQQQFMSFLSSPDSDDGLNGEKISELSLPIENEFTSLNCDVAVHEPKLLLIKPDELKSGTDILMMHKNFTSEFYCNSHKRKRTVSLPNMIDNESVSPKKRCKKSNSIDHSKHIYKLCGKKITKKQKKAQCQFVEDMLRLVNLREKIIHMLCVLFPQCGPLISDISSTCSTDNVDHLINLITSILKEPDSDDEFEWCNKWNAFDNKLSHSNPDKLLSCDEKVVDDLPVKTNPISNNSEISDHTKSLSFLGKGETHETSSACTSLCNLCSHKRTANSKHLNRNLPIESDLPKDSVKTNPIKLDLAMERNFECKENVLEKQYENNTASSKTETSLILADSSDLNKEQVIKLKCSVLEDKADLGSCAQVCVPLEKQCIDTNQSDTTTSGHQCSVFNSECFENSGTMVFNEFSDEPLSTCNQQQKMTDFVEVYDCKVLVCSNPRHCNSELQKNIVHLINQMFPDLFRTQKFENNLDNLEYLIDAIIFSNE